VVDFLMPLERSERMLRIRSLGTTPKTRLRKVPHRHGLRYRANAKELPDKPDIVFLRYKTVIFVHGCLWHRH
jgi:DNA mismatch endonuclease (patch repair protein)